MGKRLTQIELDAQRQLEIDYKHYLSLTCEQCGNHHYENTHHTCPYNDHDANFICNCCSGCKRECLRDRCTETEQAALAVKKSAELVRKNRYRDRRERLTHLYKPVVDMDHERGLCFYCYTGPATQTDHIPAITRVEKLGILHYEQLRIPLLTVPCCDKCNQRLGALPLDTLCQRVEYLIRKAHRSNDLDHERLQYLKWTHYTYHNKGWPT